MWRDTGEYELLLGMVGRDALDLAVGVAVSFYRLLHFEIMAEPKLKNHKESKDLRRLGMEDGMLVYEGVIRKTRIQTGGRRGCDVFLRMTRLCRCGLQGTDYLEPLSCIVCNTTRDHATYPHPLSEESNFRKEP